MAEESDAGHVAFLQLNNLCVVWPGRVFICFAQGVTRLPELANFWILRVLIFSVCWLCSCRWKRCFLVQMCKVQQNPYNMP